MNDWLDGIRDKKTRARMISRSDRLERGTYGDHKAVGEEVLKLRLFFGPGYHVYFAETKATVVLLLCGGDKSSQQRDIKTAQSYWRNDQDSPLKRGV